MSRNVPIDLSSSSEDDDLPSPSGLKQSKSPVPASGGGILAHPRTGLLAAHPAKPVTSLASAVPTKNNSSSSSSRGAAATKTTRQPPKKKAKPSKAYSLIWICTHGKGRRNAWRKKDLQIVGVYATKAAAEEAKREVMDRHECCGHGDIIVGGTWEDEIDLVIREAPLML